MKKNLDTEQAVRTDIKALCALLDHYYDLIGGEGKELEDAIRAIDLD